MKSCLLTLGLAAFVLASLALPHPASARPAPSDPGDPAAAVPPLVYRSPVAAPMPAASAPANWRAANDRVGRIGGWRAYAREAQSGASAPAHRH